MIKQLLPLLAVLPGLLHAQVIPFTLDGALDSVTADTDEYNTGGKISVNGVNIVVPKNLQFQFPAAWVGVKEMAEGKFLGNEVTVSIHKPIKNNLVLIPVGLRQLCEWRGTRCNRADSPVCAGIQQRQNQGTGLRRQNHTRRWPGRANQRSERRFLSRLQAPPSIHCG